jgi:hypothetical protein
MNLTTNPRHTGIRGVCFVVLLTAFALISGALAKSSSGGGGGGTTSSTNVTSTVFDVDTSGAPLLFRSDDYNGSVGEATYTSVNNIESFIDSSGVWFLNLYRQKTGTRTVYVTPDDAVGAQPTAPPAGYHWKNVEITSKCIDSSGNTVPFPNLVNGSSSCTFGVDFGYNGITYKLLIGRVLNAIDPTLGKASVVCNAVNSSNQCAAWTITAGTGTSGVVANLYSYTGRPSTPWVFIGQYYNSVRVNVTNP